MIINNIINEDYLIRRKVTMRVIIMVYRIFLDVITQAYLTVSHNQQRNALPILRTVFNEYSYIQNKLKMSLSACDLKVVNCISP
jgi:hypothetical protein